MLHMYVMTIWTHTDCGDRCNSNHRLTDVYQGVLGMVLLVWFWEIFNWQIGHLGIKIRMRILGSLHDFRIFSLGKGPFTGSWGRLEKSLYDHDHMTTPFT